MSLRVTLAIVLACAGCQGASPFTHKSNRVASQRPPAPPCAGDKPSTPDPAPWMNLPSAHAPPSAPASAAKAPPLTITQTKAVSPAPGDVTRLSHEVPAEAVVHPPPGMIPGKVQTTTTYKHHCNLNVDYLCLRLPFPHLRIFTGPDKVVTQTTFVCAPEAQPVKPEVLLPPLTH